ncbi:tlg2 [[Candida] subhashii]|uniref:Tlg2 n=1 Tax=[Candida] subhashii TaxID=561895 RepID=A0A8J5QT95_9ASCO|nr:tlg2 [[Candida] subhashii]KAG7665520.1 tlg2 [[Candida] subhashii]
MFRDRTNLFLSYRRTIPRDSISPYKSTGFSSATADDDLESQQPESQSFLHSRYSDQPDDSENGGGIEMKPIIPSIFDIAKELDEVLRVIQNDINSLNTKYKKLIIINKNERKDHEQQIDNLNYEVLKRFEKGYVLIKKFEYLSKNHEKLGLNYSLQDLEILRNFKTFYASKISEHSIVFRNLQNNYMKFLQADEDEEFGLLASDARKSTSRTSTPLPFDPNATTSASTDNIEDYSKQVLLQQQQQHGDSQYLLQREREISSLAMGILEISTIFKEMESLVIHQGTILDRIDYNLQTTVQDLKESDKELIKAKGYQKRTTKCKIIFFLCLCIFAIVMIIIVRPGGGETTRVIEKPAPTPTPTPAKPVAEPERPTLNKPGEDVPNNNIPANEVNEPGKQ